MLPSLTILLSSVCLVLRAAALPLEDYVDTGNATHALLPRAYKTDITDLFKLDGGGCDAYLTTLNSWLAEMIALHEALLQAKSDWIADMMAKSAASKNPNDADLQAQADDKKNVALRMLWDSYFGVFSGTKIKYNQIMGSLTDHIDRVTKFLSGQGLTNPLKASEKPGLFCSASVGTVQDWSMTAKDENGDEIRWDGDEDRYVMLRDLFPHLAESSTPVYPYWMSPFKGYDMLSGSRFASTICPTTQPVRQGATSSISQKRYATQFAVLAGISTQYALGTDNKHVLLCPETFSGTTAHSQNSLADLVTADNYPVSSIKRKRGEVTTKSLHTLMTRSTTLYHEIYHLTASDNMPDSWYESSSVIDRPLKNNVPVNREVLLGKSDQSISSGLESVYKAYLMTKLGVSSEAALAAYGDVDKALVYGVNNPETYAYAAMAAYVYYNAPSGMSRIMYRGTDGWNEDKIGEENE